MAQAQYEPKYMDRHRASFNFTLILALVLAAFGILSTDPLLTIVGLAFAAFAWLTTPNLYMLFDDRLVIAYGKPRLRHILFGQIENVELVQLAMTSSRVRVYPKFGRPTWLAPRDPEAFKEQLSQALESFHQEHPEGELPTQE